MSSILDSLKKLEKEASPQNYPLTRARASRKGLSPKSAIGIIGIVCVCIAAIGFAAYYQRSPEKTSEPLLEDIAPAVKSGAPETPKLETAMDEQTNPLASVSQNRKSTATAEKQDTITIDSKTITKTRSSENGNTTDEINAEQRQTAELKKAQEKKPVVDGALHKPASHLLSKDKSKPDSTGDLSEEILPPKKKPLPMGRLEGAGFKIQAISWGETPQERLAVINNQILREGDNIEGYQISQINPDDIVLRRGNKVYRLDFGLKGRP